MGLKLDENQKNMKRFINISYNNLNEAFILPCVKAILKGDDDSPIVILRPETLAQGSENHAVAFVGDMIEETEQHTWKVFRTVENNNKVRL